MDFYKKGVNLQKGVNFIYLHDASPKYKEKVFSHTYKGKIQ